MFSAGVTDIFPLCIRLHVATVGIISLRARKTFHPEEKTWINLTVDLLQRCVVDVRSFIFLDG